MIKSLWLCSWYPSEAALFNGDFIQRHAQAAAFYNHIHVIFTGGWEGEEKVTQTRNGNLSEHIILYHARNSWAGKLMNHLRWKKLFKAAVENYIYENGKPDIVHVHVPVKAGLIARWIKRKYGILYVVTEHWTIYHPEDRNNLTTRSILYKQMIKRIISGAHLLVPVSDNLGKLINQNICSKPFRVIPNNADTNFFNYHSHSIAGRFRFIHVSNLNYQKNAETIVEVFAKLSNEINGIELVLIGPVSESFSAFVNSTGQLNKTIFFKGEISYQQVAEQMKHSDALVLFSRYENLPCVIVEALCCGLPVISTPVGGIPEHLDNENSILVESENKSQLADALMAMVNNYSRYNREKIAEAAQEKFSYTATGKQFAELYSHLIKK